MGKGWKSAGWAALMGCAGLLVLAGCDGGPARSDNGHAAGSVAPPTAYGSAAPSGSMGAASSVEPASTPAEDRAPVPLVNGKPMWAANRRHSAQENAEYQFNRDGPDFGARSVDEFVRKAHAFVEDPPSDVQTLTRDNGDRLLYDPQGNVFAVVAKDGAPRAMFKPRDGMSYWQEQKDRVAERENGQRGGYRHGGDRSSGGSGGEGSDDQG